MRVLNRTACLLWVAFLSIGLLFTACNLLPDEKEAGPLIVGQPLDDTTKPGGLARFIVSSSVADSADAHRFSYRWLVDGQPFPDSIESDREMLYFHPSAEWNGRKVSVEVRRGGRMETSREATLIVRRLLMSAPYAPTWRVSPYTFERSGGFDFFALISPYKRYYYLRLSPGKAEFVDTYDTTADVRIDGMGVSPEKFVRLRLWNLGYSYLYSTPTLYGLSEGAIDGALTTFRIIPVLATDSQRVPQGYPVNDPDTLRRLFETEREKLRAWYKANRENAASKSDPRWQYHQGLFLSDDLRRSENCYESADCTDERRAYMWGAMDFEYSTKKLTLFRVQAFLLRLRGDRYAVIYPPQSWKDSPEYLEFQGEMPAAP